MGTVLFGAAAFAAAPAVAIGQVTTAGLWPTTPVQPAGNVLNAAVMNPGFHLAATGSSPRTESLQAASRTHRRTGTGFAVGAILSAAAASAVFNGSTCTGSGDYLSICRAGYLGSVAVGAGLGGVFGHATRRPEPPGRSLALFRGAAAGALGGFALSIPFCANSFEKNNPAVLCGREGMPTAVHTVFFAAGGAIIANVLSREPSRSNVRFGLAPGFDGSASLSARIAWR